VNEEAKNRVGPQHHRKEKCIKKNELKWRARCLVRSVHVRSRKARVRVHVVLSGGLGDGQEQD
jgi:hypothetical protein